MNWLLLDTSCPRAVVALSVDGSVAALRYLTETKQHSELLSPAVNEVLAEANLEMADLNGVAVGKGPGSFIGVRVAMAFAKGLCVALEIPLLGVGTLSALAHEPSLPAGQGAAIIDARRAEFYVQNFVRTGQQVSAVDDPHLMPVEGLWELNAQSSFVIGTWPELALFVTGPSAEGLLAAFLATTDGLTNLADETHGLVPDYVRDPDAKPTWDQPIVEPK